MSNGNDAANTRQANTQASNDANAAPGRSFRLRSNSIARRLEVIPHKAEAVWGLFYTEKDAPGHGCTASPRLDLQDGNQPNPPLPADSPEVRRYNRIQRWLSMTDTVIGFALLVVLLVTGWTGKLRDWSYLGATALFPSRLSLRADVFRDCENPQRRSTSSAFGWSINTIFPTRSCAAGCGMSARAGWSRWCWARSWSRLIYGIIRVAPQRWWIIAWAVFIGLFLLMAQLAPVVLMPIFYKFEPLANDSLRDRLTKLGERAGTRVRGVYEWKLSEKSNKANAALTGLGSTRRIILSDTLLQHYSDDEIEAILAHELGHHVHKHILKSIFTQVGDHVLRVLADQRGAAFRDREGLVPGARFAAVRLRQPAADCAGGDDPGICADAGAECDLAASRAAGRSLRVGEHAGDRAVHHLDAEAGRPESGRARSRTSSSRRSSTRIRRSANG